MNKEKYINDIAEIKDIMDRSSRFISLSGLSGIFAGITAIIGAALAYKLVYGDNSFQGYEQVILTKSELQEIIVIALSTLLIAFLGAFLLTRKKAKTQKQSMWDRQSQRLFINLLIPLASGGILSLMMLLKGYIGFVAPLTLIFYGLALVNASKYTLTEIRSLGIIEILLGLISFQYIGYGLIFWTIGFGILHIIYGIIMHFRHGS